MGNAQSADPRVFEIPLVIKLGEGSIITREVFDLKVLSEASSCLNEALKESREPYQIRFTIKRFEKLSLEEESGISSNIGLDYHRVGGLPAIKKAGRQADEFEVIISQKVNVAHVSYHLSELALKYYDSGVGRRISELARRYSELCDLNQECAVQDPSQIANLEMRRIYQEIKRLELPYQSIEEELGNSVYLKLDEFEFHLEAPNDAFRSSRQFSHEIIHAWGYLKDVYTNPSANQDNLMGDFSCKFTPEQIQMIRRLRGI